MASVHQLQPVRRREYPGAQVDPDKLHEQLEPTTTVVVTFGKEAELNRFRRLLYSINAQGTYRYRTMRDEYSMWGVVVWRMK